MKTGERWDAPDTETLRKEWEAKERLEKAAPDLLAACERTLAYLKIHDPQYVESNSDGNALIKAIAKAKEGI